jgi:hypothetical protein
VPVGIVGLGGMLTKFSPVLLSNIPFQISQTCLSHELCTWMSVAVLGYCLLVLAWYIFYWNRNKRGDAWRNLPIDPQTLAGRMHFVCNSRMLRDFERLSMLGQKLRDGRVERMKNKYCYGPILGLSSGESMMGNDYAENQVKIQLRAMS